MSEQSTPVMTEADKLRAQIAAERAKAEGRKNETAAKVELQKLQIDLEAARLETESQEIIARFAEELGPKGIKWDTMPSEMGIVVIRRPTRVRYNEWLRQENQTDPDAMMAFASTCVAYPELQKFDAIITNQPAKLLTATAIANRLGGSNVKEIEGK